MITIIIFNGEIYNHLELKKDLKKEKKIKSNLTEVLLKSYKVYGQIVKLFRRNVELLNF